MLMANIDNIRKSFFEESSQSSLGRLGFVGFLFFLLATMGIASTGSGRWLMFGSLSIRMVLLIISGCLTLPILIKNIKKILLNQFTVSLILLAIVIAINAARGILSENNNYVLMQDLRGFAYFIVFPLLLVYLKDKKRLEIFMKCIIFSSTLLGVVVLWVAIQFAFTMGLSGWNFYHLHEISFIWIVVEGDLILRIFSQSHLYFICNIAFSIYFYLREKPKKYTFIYCISSSLSLLGIWVTFARSSYLAVFVGAVIVMIAVLLINKQYKYVLLYGIKTVALFGFLIFVISFPSTSNYLSLGISRVLVSFESYEWRGDYIPAEEYTPPYEPEHPMQVTIDSDALRALTAANLREQIMQSPIFGSGLGAATTVRDDGFTEFFYLDTVNKMGIVGLFTYLLPLILMLIIATRAIYLFLKKKADQPQIVIIVIACLIAFMTASIFNPYMNSLLGIFMYCTAMAICSADVFNKTSIKEQLSGIDI